ncbi:MAG: four helix bundle protein [Kofleriaceae bacterium]
MLHFRELQVYRCSVELLPKAYAIATALDGELANQLRRAAVSINLNIAEGTGRFERDQRRFLITARGSALECGAIFDAALALGIAHPEISASDLLAVRIVQMLTKMIAQLDEAS